MSHMTRRQFLAYSVTTGALVALPSLPFSRGAALAAAEGVTTIRAGMRTIEVNGRSARVFGLLQPDGTHGLITEAGKRFRVRLENNTDEKTLIHWHGLVPPFEQDGVPGLSQPLLPPGEAYDYDFPLKRPGTHWMHSHEGLQEQRLMAAPLIVRDPQEAGADVQEIVVMLHDFTFRDPQEILAGLREGGHGNGHGDGHGGGHGNGHAGVHLHDVDYDAFLANDRTLADPEVYRVERGGRVRLRIINAATATNFRIDLGRIEGRLIAVDGMPVEPLTGTQFEMAIAQRLDIAMDLPRSEGAWPVFAVREGERDRTGFVLATANAEIRRLSEKAHHPVAAVGLDLEARLRAAMPLEQREPDRRHTLRFSEAHGYTWKINGAVFGEHQPLHASPGERVEITFIDDTTMAHPMHLHGHHFQVVEINGRRIAGAMRDTVLVPAGGRVTIAFDADNPGRWALHCHHLYHMAGGMMTTLEYGV